MKNINAHLLGQIRSLPDVDVLVDVGVANGTPWFYERYPAAHLHLVDPLPLSGQAKSCVMSRPYDVHQVALGSAASVKQFSYNVDVPALSSLLQRTSLTATSHKYRTLEVDVVRLDHLLGPRYAASNKKIGLKIDTEGYELEVLRGATHLLPRCEFVICEASIKKRFEASYTFEELILFMHEAGFRVESVLSAAFDGNGICRFIDIAFVQSMR